MAQVIDGKALAKKIRENLKVECNELKEKGYRVISGKVPTKYFEEKFYGMAVG